MEWWQILLKGRSVRCGMTSNEEIQIFGSLIPVKAIDKNKPVNWAQVRKVAKCSLSLEWVGCLAVNFKNKKPFFNKFLASFYTQSFLAHNV